MNANQGSRSIGWIVTAIAIVVVATGVSEGGQRDPGWSAPLVVESRANPLAQRPEVLAGGERLFRQRCSTCHGADGRGSRKGPALVTGDVQAETDGALFWRISSGNTRRGMPTFSFLPEPQRWQLVMALRSLDAIKGHPKR
ncbi:MAG TPA: c-type cytochrome [Vicinamibacterales bacterium]|jgi:mono/diheme cytochrome c family protein